MRLLHLSSRQALFQAGMRASQTHGHLHGDKEVGSLRNKMDCPDVIGKYRCNGLYATSKLQWQVHISSGFS